MTPFDEALVRMRAAFLQQGGERAEVLREAWRGNDQETIRDVAHKISGFAGMVGLEELGHLAAHVEDLIDRHAVPEEIMVSAHDLAEELARLHDSNRFKANDD